MPGGNTHDAVTFLLAVPVGIATYAAETNVGAAVIVAVLFVFGGLMFGPDLDTRSRQYYRWSVFRIIWLPYRTFFRHRSRLTHGLVLGSLIRVVYFLGAITLIVLACSYLWVGIKGGKLPVVDDVAALWRAAGVAIQAHFGAFFLYFVFAGLWLGAASHTLTDVAGSYIKTGRRGKVL